MESFFLDNKDIANFKIPIFLSFTVSFSIFRCRHWKTAAIFECITTRYLCTKFHVNSLFQWRL